MIWAVMALHHLLLDLWLGQRTVIASGVECSVATGEAVGLQQILRFEWSSSLPGTAHFAKAPGRKDIEDI